MPIIHLVRHGTHDEVGRILSGRSDIPLNATGKAEAFALERALTAVPLSAVHSSPRARALETASPLARSRELKVQVQPALDEVDFGEFMGKSFEVLGDEPGWHHWNAERASARCPNGENMAEVVDRAARFLFALADDVAVCVTHCDVIRGLLTHLLAMPMERMFMLDCDPGSLTTLSIQDGDVRLVTLNQRWSL